MTNTISIFTMSGNVFQELSYNTINELTTKLKIIFNNSILSNLEDYDYITIIFSQKKDLY